MSSLPFKIVVGDFDISEAKLLGPTGLPQLGNFLLQRILGAVGL